MRSFPTVEWDGRRICFTESRDLPEAPSYAVVTIVVWHGLLLLAHIAGRGWSVPSGRLLPDEGPWEAARRETYEETGGLLGELTPLGWYTIGAPSEQPLLVPLFTAALERLDPIPAGFESTGVMLAAELELPRLYYHWDPLLEAVFRHAAEMPIRPA
jgi:8-oxo-dGTP diphosphatase